MRLDKREFNVVVRKGKKPKIRTKVIQLNVLPYWKEVLEGAKPDDFVFSVNYVPGPVEKNPRNAVTQFYNDNVKKVLGILKDFYGLKHLHSNLVAEATKNVNPLETVKEINSQETDEIASIYAFDAVKQVNEMLKNVELDIFSEVLPTKKDLKIEKNKNLNIAFV